MWAVTMKSGLQREKKEVDTCRIKTALVGEEGLASLPPWGTLIYCYIRINCLSLRSSVTLVIAKKRQDLTAVPSGLVSFGRAGRGLCLMVLRGVGYSVLIRKF